MPAPVGAVMVMVPVATVHVGWIKVAVGAAGVAGWALIISLVPEEIQLTAFFAVTVYVPVETRLKIPVVLV